MIDIWMYLVDSNGVERSNAFLTQTLHYNRNVLYDELKLSLNSKDDGQKVPSI